MNRLRILIGALVVLLLVALLVFVNPPWGAEPDPDSSGPGTPGAESTDLGTNKNGPGAVEAGATPDRVEILDAAPSGPSWTIRGRVRLSGTLPIAGAELQIFEGHASDETGAINIVMSQIARMDPHSEPSLSLSTEGDPIASGEVAADGSFVVEGVRHRHVRLALAHDFYGLREVMPLHLTPERRDVDVGVLDSYLGAFVRGRVIGDALDGASTRLIVDPDPMSVIRDPQSFMSLMGSFGRLETEVRDGTFAFRAVWPSPSNQVLARAGSQFIHSPKFTLQPGEFLELQLPIQTGSALTVRVTDADGTEIENARVRVAPTDISGDMSRAWVTRRGRTGADGLTTIEGLSVGEYRVAVSAHDFQPNGTQVTVPGNDIVELTLSRGRAIRGLVTDADGAPVADAGVIVVPIIEVPVLGDLTSITGTDLLGMGAEGSRHRTDAEGHFTIRGLADGEFHLVADHEDFIAGITRDVAVGSEDAVVALKRPGRIVGQVVAKETGEPLHHFSVATMTSMFVMKRPSRAIDVADSEDGTFELGDIAPGRATVELKAPGRGTITVKATVEEGELADLGKVELPLPARIRGRVIDEDGVGIAFASVTRRQAGFMENPIMASFSGQLQVFTDESGAFEFTAAPGRLALTARADGYAMGHSARLRLADGEVLENIIITLGHGGTIVGKLLLPPGGDPTTWDIAPNKMPSGASQTAHPNADGTFRIENVDPGKYDVQAFRASMFQALDDSTKNSWMPGQAVDLSGFFETMNDSILHARATVRAGEEVEVTLDGRDLEEVGGTVLQLRITLGGRVLQNGYAEITHTETGRHWLGFVTSGRMQVRSVPAGSLGVQIRGGISMQPVGPLTTVEYDGTNDPVDLQLAGGRIRGVVYDDQTGDPLTAALVKLYDEERSGELTSQFGFAMTNQKGEFLFEGLTPSTYTVVADDRLGLFGTKDVSSRARGVRVRGNAVESVVLRARPGSGLTVRVLDKLGTGVSGAMVIALDENNQPLGTVPVAFSSPDGRAFLSGLPAGMVRVVARGQGLAPGVSEAVMLEQGAQRTIEVTLTRGTRVIVEPRDANGELLRGAVVSGRVIGGAWVPPSLLVRSRTRDGIDLGPLPPGRWEFIVQHPKAGKFPVTRDIPAGKSATLILSPGN